MRVNIRTRTCICVHATQRTLHACVCVNMRVCWCPLSPYHYQFSGKAKDLIAMRAVPACMLSLPWWQIRSSQSDALLKLKNGKIHCAHRIFVENCVFY